MTIFNSLGSNYDFPTAMRTFFSFAGAARKRELTAYLEERYGGKSVLTYKGRDALTLALSALPQKGVVAVNGYTCLAVYQAIAASGNKARYLDVAPNMLDYSPETLRRACEADAGIHAVIVQNTLGFPIDIAPVEKFCEERGLTLIEDLAHSIGARYADGRECGTVGDFVMLSFSQDKVVDAVSGGALIVRNARYSVEQPTTSVPFVQQLKDRFYPVLTWKVRLAYRLGSGAPYHALLRALRVLSSPFGKERGALALPSWYCGNVLRQYKQLNAVSAHRKAIAEVYARDLDKRVQLGEHATGASYLRFPILVDDRDGLIAELKRHGVHVSDIWYDAPVAPKKYLGKSDYAGQCPNAEVLSARMLNLPTHINVSTSDARHIARIVNEWLRERADHEIVAITDGAEWEAFMRAQKPHSFLHSWLWGEQNRATGSKVFRIGVKKNGALTAAALFIKVDARRGAFLLCPHGPVVAQSGDEAAVLKQLFAHAEGIARAEQCAFVRICPLAEDSAANRAMYRTLGFRGAPIHMHPELAWMLDITKPEEELLKEMRKTTRYTIKKMEKEGVQVEMSPRPDDIEKFWPVYQATVQRQQFTPFKKSDLRKEFELFANKNQAAFFFGKQNNEVVAAAIIIFYNGQAFYHHSGSTSAGSNVSYLLQWRVIQEAKRRGCTLYNFWGISPAGRPKHPWAGLSLFKKGFGGFSEAYLHAQDKPLTWKYGINYAVETVRRIRRGL
jgi:dTDP-4-amino-4,6-dideoxygalactose transaminase/lipid II:glycine glycyltransferase (peptidoglycan interpeptide bridge formation enzyme)